MPEEEAQAGLTAEQERLGHRMNELLTAEDWRGIAALESAAMALARDLRLAHPAAAGAIHTVCTTLQRRDAPPVVRRLQLVHPVHQALLLGGQPRLRLLLRHPWDKVVSVWHL